MSLSNLPLPSSTSSGSSSMAVSMEELWDFVDFSLKLHFISPAIKGVEEAWNKFLFGLKVIVGNDSNSVGTTFETDAPRQILKFFSELPGLAFLKLSSKMAYINDFQNTHKKFIKSKNLHCSWYFQKEKYFVKSFL